MLSVVILDGGEENVIKLTYEQLFKELKSLPETELIVAKDWFDALSVIHNKFVCFVEPDCLVNSGYFSSQMGLFKKSSQLRKLAMLSSSTGVNTWANRVFGYCLGNDYSDGLIPVKEKHSSAVYPVQVGFLPGSIIRVEQLKKALASLNMNNHKAVDLVTLSALVSLEFWRQGDGNRVHINPNATYVSTEDYVGDIHKVPAEVPEKLVAMFKQESI